MPRDFASDDGGSCYDGEERIAALRLAVECYQSNGDPKTAKQFYMEWFAESPNDSTALNNFALLLAEDLNDPVSAKKYCLRAYDATGKDNPDPLIVDTRGWVLTLCGGTDADEGLSILKSLVDAHKDFLGARYHLAIAYLHQNRRADALAQVKVAQDQIKALEAGGQKVKPRIKADIQKAFETLSIPRIDTLIPTPCQS